MVAALLLLRGVSPADTVEECRMQCTADFHANSANCPPPGRDNDRERSQCLSDFEHAARECRAECIDAPPPGDQTDLPAQEPNSVPAIPPPDASK
jgi:hypothetical protein